MEIVWKSAVISLSTVFLGIILGKQEKEFRLLLNIAGCSIVILLCSHFLKPILDLINDLQTMADIRSEDLKIVTKAVAIAIVVDYTELICADCGFSTLGKAMQYLGSVAIIWISVPVLRSLLSFINQIMGEL